MDAFGQCLLGKQLRLKVKKNDKVLNDLQSAFGYRLGKFVDIGRIGLFPLSLIRAEKLVKNNVIMFGNAAHFLHPVSAQGFNLSVRDIGTLQSLIQKYGISENNDRLMSEYEGSRLYDQKRTSVITSRLIDVFGDQSFMFQTGRKVGLHLLERSSFAKQVMNKIMMGRDGKLSRLHLSKVES